MKTIIHVDQHAIRANLKGDGESRPPISVKAGRLNRKTDRAEIRTPDGKLVATIVYFPDKPLKCGARVWIETELEVHVADSVLLEEQEDLCERVS